jgi:tetratricopeptide (TPR) repeat protein
VKKTGTVVEFFGEPPRAVLIEVADEHGVPLSFVTKKSDEVKTIWTLTEVPRKELELSEEAQFFERGLLFLQNGLILQAKAEFSKAFAIDPRLAGSLLNLTTRLIDRKAFGTAIRIYELILELQPQYQPARENLVATHVNRGMDFARRGNLYRAIEDFNLGLMHGPSEKAVDVIRKNLVASYTQIGIRHSEIKQYQEAIEYFLWALELEPSEITRRNLAVALVAASAAKSEGQPLSAYEESFRQPIRMGLTLSECLNAYGATLASIGRIREARSALTAALEADPKNQIAEKNLGALKEEAVPTGLIAGLNPLEVEEPASH